MAISMTMSRAVARASVSPSSSPGLPLTMARHGTACRRPGRSCGVAWSFSRRPIVHSSRGRFGYPIASSPTSSRRIGLHQRSRTCATSSSGPPGPAASNRSSEPSRSACGRCSCGNRGRHRASSPRTRPRPRSRRRASPSTSGAWLPRPDRRRSRLERSSRPGSPEPFWSPALSRRSPIGRRARSADSRMRRVPSCWSAPVRGTRIGPFQRPLQLDAPPLSPVEHPEAWHEALTSDERTGIAAERETDFAAATEAFRLNAAQNRASGGRRPAPGTRRSAKPPALRPPGRRTSTERGRPRTAGPSGRAGGGLGRPGGPGGRRRPAAGAGCACKAPRPRRRRLGHRRTFQPRGGAGGVVRRPTRNRQDHGRPGPGPRTRPRPVRGRPLDRRRQVHRRTEKRLAQGFTEGERDNGTWGSTRPMPSSDSAPRCGMTATASPSRVGYLLQRIETFDRTRDPRHGPQAPTR